VAFDLLVKGGTVVDPSQKLHKVCDVAFSRGKVAAVGKSIPKSQAKEVLDATGLIVTPGLVDMHTHVFWGVSHYGIDADETCLAKGVTTVVDAGSAGAATFAAFRRYDIEQKRTRIIPLLHISAQGLLFRPIEELQDIRWANVEAAVRVAKEHADIILGMKVRLTDAIVAGRDMAALINAIAAAEQIGKPLMIHIGNTPSPLPHLLRMLRQGDIVTHCFTGRQPTVLDDRGEVLAEVRRARERGIIFDQGHGAGSHSFEVAKKALAQGFAPDTISSDLHVYSLPGPVHDLPTCLSKWLHLGMALDEAVRLSTEAPAKLVGMAGKIGTLKVGAEGDMAAFRMKEGAVTFTDSYGNKMEGKRQLVPEMVVKGGKVCRAK
jgi:dihydroorotase